MSDERERQQREFEEDLEQIERPIRDQLRDRLDEPTSENNVMAVGAAIHFAAIRSYRTGQVAFAAALNRLWQGASAEERQRMLAEPSVRVAFSDLAEVDLWMDWRICEGLDPGDDGS